MIDSSAHALRYIHGKLDVRLPTPQTKSESSDGGEPICQGGDIATAFVKD